MIRERDKKQPTLPGFESPFERSLSPNNRWIKLADVVPWDEFATAYYSGMCADQGAPAKPARLMVGAVIIKHRQRWTDEETVLQIQENPYLQFFCGFSGFTLDQPFAPSLFVEIRKRMGAAVYEQFEQSVATKLSDILKEKEKKAKPPTQRGGGVSASGHDMTEEKAPAAAAEPIDQFGKGNEVTGGVEAAESTEQTGKTSELVGNVTEVKLSGKLIIDATVAEQAIRYPTDLGLLNEAREVSERLIDRLFPLSGLQKKPRTYRQKARQDFLALVKKRKPRQITLRQAIRQQLQYLRRNLGHIDAMLDRIWPSEPAPLGGIRPNLSQEWSVGLSHRHLRQLWVIREVYDQQKHMYDNRLRSYPHRIVSISQPHVRPIIRGKAGVSVEFGAKLSASLDDNGLARVDELRWEAFNESADLTGQVEAFKKRHGHYPAVVLADGIYGTRDNRCYCKEKGIRFGGKPLGRPKKETEANREELREAKKQRRRDHLERIPIEGKFGQGKNRHGLAKIRAKLASTSASWIRAIFLVMNLNLLLRFFFALDPSRLNAVFARLLTQMVDWPTLVRGIAARLQLLQGRTAITAGAF
ncbi:MAG: IS5 family transposase [Magnetococcales bacterium]|nr:IS5 family transposase [Magnetococcales bacterium]